MRDYIHFPECCISDGAYSILPVQDGHIEAIRIWRNEQMDVLRQKEPISMENQTRYFDANIWPDMYSKHPANVLVSYMRDCELIGYGGLVHIAWDFSRAEVSFLLAPQFVDEREGYRRLHQQFLGFIKMLAFSHLGLNRIYTETYSFRTFHIQGLEGAGFKCEGKMKEHVRIGGKPYDSILHGCLRSYEQ